MTDIETRMDKLEQRVHALEKLAQIGEMMRDDLAVRKENELVHRYGEHVDKTTAARILGVIRVTVYNMLADGRIDGMYGGKRVSVRSIARYIYSNERKGKK